MPVFRAVLPISDRVCVLMTDGIESVSGISNVAADADAVAALVAVLAAQVRDLGPDGHPVAVDEESEFGFERVHIEGERGRVPAHASRRRLFEAHSFVHCSRRSL